MSNLSNFSDNSLLSETMEPHGIAKVQRLRYVIRILQDIVDHESQMDYLSEEGMYMKQFSMGARAFFRFSCRGLYQFVFLTFYFCNERVA